MREKPKVEPVRIVRMSQKLRVKCLLLISRKAILSWSTNFTSGKTGKSERRRITFLFSCQEHLKQESRQVFKAAPAGVNKLNGLMNIMVKKTGIVNERLQNHSGREKMIQTLSKTDIPPKHILSCQGTKI